VIALDGERAGFLAVASRDPGRRGGTSDDFHGTEVASLLAVQPARAALVDAAFVPLASLLRGGEPVELRLTGRGGRATVVDLGAVDLLDPAVAVGRIRIEGIEHVDGIDLRGNDRITPERLVAAGRVELLVGGEIVLAADGGAVPVAFEPVGRPLRGARAGAGDYLDVDALPGTGTVALVFVTPEGERAVVETGAWKKVGGRPYTAPRAWRGPLAVR